jgi:protein O-mannosyl-transferase
LGAWFFLILAPTSSVFPIRDLAFEHRMYLPLAAVVASVVIGGYLVGQWLVRNGRTSRPTLQVASVSLLILTAVALGVLTFERNADYRDQMSIWGDTVAKVPGNERARNNFGAALLDGGRSDEATLQFEAALGINPDYADAQRNLGIARSKRGKILKALVAQREALHSRPDDIRLLNDTAWTLATNPNASIRNSTEAIELAGRAVQLSREQEPAVLGTLAAAYAEAGRFSEAVKTAEQAVALAARQNNRSLVDSINAKISLYEAKTPFRETQQLPVAGSAQP